MPRSTPTRVRALSAALLLVVVGGAVACTDDDAAGRAPAAVPTTVAPLAELQNTPDETPTIPLPPGFEPADTRGQPLLGLPDLSETAQPVLEVWGGAGTISGRVQRPDGSGVGGARVRLERFVGNRGGYVDVGTNDDGEYSAVGLLGGHYRVRAWLQPDLATVAPQATFLDADGSVTIDLPVEVFDGRKLSAAIVVPEAEVGVATFLDALLVDEDVDENGVVRGTPVPDTEVSVLPLEGVRIDSDNPAKTDGDGRATFVLMCLTAAPHTLAVFAGEDRFAYELPACKPGTGEIPPPPTSTTEPGAPTTTEPVATFAVGSAFRPPFVGPVPAGTYLARSGSGCETTYEQWVDGRWALRRTSGSTLRLSSPARNFRTVGAAAPCTFTRFA